MAGRKTFVAGEILTASDVNGFLMDQAVQVYDDATARDTALPSPLQGQLVYLKDQDTVQKYNGAAFLPVGGLIETKSAIKTDKFSASVVAGGSTAVTGLSITHETQNPANKLIIVAFFGNAANASRTNDIGIAVSDGSSLLSIGNASGNRTRVTAGGRTNPTSSDSISTNLHMTIVHTPGAGSKTYTVNAVNVDVNTRTLFVNRTELDNDSAARPVGASALILMEVAV